MVRANNYAEAIRLAEDAAERASARRAELYRQEENRRQRLFDAGRPRWFRPWRVNYAPVYLPIDIWVDVACGTDPIWRGAVSENQWFMQQASMYAARDTPTWI